MRLCMIWWEVKSKVNLWWFYWNSMKFIELENPAILHELWEQIVLHHEGHPFYFGVSWNAVKHKWQQVKSLLIKIQLRLACAQIPIFFEKTVLWTHFSSSSCNYTNIVFAFACFPRRNSRRWNWIPARNTGLKFIFEILNLFIN